jgi:hypothetical protein
MLPHRLYIVCFQLPYWQISGMVYVVPLLHLCGDDPAVFVSFLLSRSLLHQTCAMLCPGSVDQRIGWQVLGCYIRDGGLTGARKIKSNEWFTRLSK